MLMKLPGILPFAAMLAACALGAGAAAAADPGQGGRRRGDQNMAYDQVRRGEIRSLSEIESRVIPRMHGARYLGPELHEDRYRLKFMENGAVIWVDVDPRTGAIIGRAGD